jgi:sugar/nucleoside kinase (ribokinase family)
MSHEYDVLVYGTVCMDVLWRVAKLPPPGGYVDILEERREIGGEAANTAMALTRWGVKVALVGNALGNDEDGRLLRELFARDAPNIDLRFLTTSAAAFTPYCVCMATPDGQRTMFGYRFTEMQPPALDPTLAASARLFTMEPNAYAAGAEACRVASAAGLFTLPMDYARDPAINAIASQVVTSSEHIGRDLSAVELAAFATQVRDDYGPTTIVTWGERGCFVAERGQAGLPALHVPAYQAPRVIDTTGSGDIFRAGLLYGQLQAWDILTTVRFASAAAALNCGEMGGWCGVQSLDKIRFFQQEANTASASTRNHFPSPERGEQGWQIP